MAGMECKLCSKRFSNGKALGGHMRSHYATLPLPPKTPQRQEEEPSDPPTESTSSFFSSDEREGDERESSAEKSSLSCGLRENPKKRLRLVDPELLETESRFKRAKGVDDEEPLMEEDVALCLVMLSRDVWRSSEDSRMSVKAYKCERCGKVFKSSQGLGSHRASHFKKIKSSFDGFSENDQFFRKPKEIVVKEQVHECPFCGKIFRSAQALGGHKRSHLLASKFVGRNVSDKLEDDSSIDLNLPPAAMEDEDEEFVSEEERCFGF
ncbi:Zinc finger protein ZAT9 [Sesamum alatum]|uniref:Zinc finger protein ZAT9 n=1 Tax=Sesamum alatum TaxID=300844 RepID=A0AAE1YR33_9LAMI|nr:Zinc finger protein ZAT9 [Sesamum alatum]